MKIMIFLRALKFCFVFSQVQDCLVSLVLVQRLAGFLVFVCHMNGLAGVMYAYPVDNRHVGLSIFGLLVVVISFFFFYHVLFNCSSTAICCRFDGTSGTVIKRDQQGYSIYS